MTALWHRLTHTRRRRHEARCLAFASFCPVAASMRVGFVDSTLLRLVLFRRMVGR
jgi:hypothetical protein